MASIPTHTNSKVPHRRHKRHTQSARHHPSLKHPPALDLHSHLKIHTFILLNSKQVLVGDLHMNLGQISIRKKWGLQRTTRHSTRASLLATPTHHPASNNRKAKIKPTTTRPLSTRKTSRASKRRNLNLLLSSKATHRSRSSQFTLNQLPHTN